MKKKVSFSAEKNIDGTWVGILTDLDGSKHKSEKTNYPDRQTAKAGMKDEYDGVMILFKFKCHHFF